MKYPHIFQPLKIKNNFILNNRIVMPPMCGNLGGADGQITDEHIKYYEQRAKGGTGLIIVENCNIDYPIGANGATQLRIDKERYIPRLSELVGAIKKYGAKTCVQINHAGASTTSARTEGYGPVAPSDISSKPGGPAPRPLTKDEIYDIIEKYGKAALRAKIAGFDAVEVHAGHSYLINQFLSPTLNKRTDEFGCQSLENRARFCILVLQEVRKNIGPEFPIFIRLSADEFTKNGIQLKETLCFIELFKPYIDVLDVSGGTNYTLEKQIETMNYPEGAKVYLSEAIKKQFDIPTIIAGNIRHPEYVERILAEHKTDLVAIGRGLICDPHWVMKAYRGEPETIRKCISCNIGCVGNRIFNSVPIKCSLNPDIIGEDEYKSHKVKFPTTVVVIGGGPAGLEAACTAAEVGCNTFLFEKENKIGGLLRQIDKFPAKGKIEYAVEYFEARIAKLKNLVVHYGKVATCEEIAQLHPDLVVNATGATPSLPPIKGLREHVNKQGSSLYTIMELLKNIDSFEASTGKNVVIAGGGAVGLDCVEFFAQKGARVTIIERLPQLGVDLDPLTKKYLLGVVDQYHVKVFLNTTIEEFIPNQIYCSGADGKKINFNFDVTVVCLGLRPNNQHVEAMKQYFVQQNVEFINIGDSVRARKIIFGISEGRNILNSLTLRERF